MDQLKSIYRRRFNEDADFRNELYKILCSDFFQKYIPVDSTLLEIAAGHCEFTNNINAKKKIALDLNADVMKFAAKGVTVIHSPSTKMHGIKDRSIDIVYTSNFFEHLEKPDIVKTIQEMHRVIKDDGTVLLLQPNMRYCYKDYWMFFDHITPLDDRSLTEVLEVNGFKVVECRPRFLPYTTKSTIPRFLFFVKLYLRLPFLQWLFGKQAFLVAKKA